MFGQLGTVELLLVCAIGFLGSSLLVLTAVLLIVGSGRVSGIGSELGKGIRRLRQGLEGTGEEETSE